MVLQKRIGRCWVESLVDSGPEQIARRIHATARRQLVKKSISINCLYAGGSRPIRTNLIALRTEAGNGWEMDGL